MQHGHEDLAYKDLGKYILDNVRGALTVGLVLEKRFAPKPSGSKPTTTSPQSTTEGGADRLLKESLLKHPKYRLLKELQAPLLKHQ